MISKAGNTSSATAMFESITYDVHLKAPLLFPDPLGDMFRR